MVRHGTRVVSRPDLGVQEEPRAVRGDREGAAKLGARGEPGGAGGLGHELLDGEEEGHPLAAGKLHRQAEGQRASAAG